jgi:hypothetical protein
MPRTSREVTAEALREIDARMSRQETLLEDIKRILVGLADGQSEHRHHTRDAIDRLGTRVHALEHARASNGGE